MERTIYVDIDSTFFPAEVEYARAEKRLHGTEDLIHNWYDIPELEHKYGKDYRNIFWEALHPDRVMERKPYPDAVNGILHLHFGLGFDVHFITHNPFPDAMEGPLSKWLDGLFMDVMGFDYGLTVYEEGNCKITTMQNDPTAWGIIEDKPTTLIRAVKEGYHTFAKLHIWNEELVYYWPKIQGFQNWKFLPMMVGQTLTNEAKRAKIGACL